GAPVSSEVYLDNIAFGPNIFVDTSEAPDDGAILFSDDNTDGKDPTHQDLTIRNVTNQPVTVDVDVGASKFLVYNGSTGKVVLNDNNGTYRLVTGQTIPAGGQFVLHLQSQVADDFYKNLTTEDDLLLKTAVIVTVNADGLPPDVETADLFFLADA